MQRQKSLQVFIDLLVLLLRARARTLLWQWERSSQSHACRLDSKLFVKSGRAVIWGKYITHSSVYIPAPTTRLQCMWRRHSSCGEIIASVWWNRAEFFLNCHKRGRHLQDLLYLCSIFYRNSTAAFDDKRVPDWERFSYFSSRYLLDIWVITMPKKQEKVRSKIYLCSKCHQVLLPT